MTRFPTGTRQGRKHAGTVSGLLALLLAATTLLLYLSSLEDDRFFRELSRVVLEEPAARDPREICVRLLDFSSKIPHMNALPSWKAPGWVRIYYRFWPFKPDPRAVVRHGADYRGPCGSRSRVLAALLDSQGIPARLTSLHKDGKAMHTVVEAECGPKGWAVLDPTYNLYFPDERGALLSASEIKDRREYFLNITRGKLITAYGSHSPYQQEQFTYEDVYPFNWEAVPVVLPAVRSMLSPLISGEKLDRLFRWPASYRRPKVFTAQICGALSLFFFMVRLARKRRQTARRPLGGISTTTDR